MIYQNRTLILFGAEKMYGEGVPTLLSNKARTVIHIDDNGKVTFNKIADQEENSFKIDRHAKAEETKNH